jgi:glycogen synthase
VACASAASEDGLNQPRYPATDRCSYRPRYAHATIRRFTATCNAVICCSFNEALPLYVLEGMSMGHIVLRNDAGGMEEQLAETVNGFRQVADRILRGCLGTSTVKRPLSPKASPSTCGEREWRR